MSQMETIKGRLVKGFDGNMTDKETGEHKKLTPSLTVLDESTGLFHKFNVSDEDYQKYSPGMMQPITITGVLEKPAQPAKYIGYVVAEKKSN